MTRRSAVAVKPWTCCSGAVRQRQGELLGLDVEAKPGPSKYSASVIAEPRDVVVGLRLSSAASSSIMAALVAESVRRVSRRAWACIASEGLPGAPP